jgi:hypothetical protein
MVKNVLFLILITLFGCIVPKKILPDDLSINTPKLPLKIEEIKVEDGRGQLKSMDWDVKVLTLKNQTYEGNPKLTAEQIKLVQDIITKSSSPDGTPAKIKFVLKEGFCRMKHHYSEVSEYTQVKGEIMVDIYPRGMKYSGYAQLYYTYNHPTANKEHILQLYDVNLKNVTHNVLEIIKNELLKE